MKWNSQGWTTWQTTTPDSDEAQKLKVHCVWQLLCEYVKITFTANFLFDDEQQHRGLWHHTAYSVLYRSANL